jgi:hypothetical protein
MRRLSKMSAYAVVLMVIAGASPSLADSGWRGPGWYEEAGDLGIVVGPFGSYDECRAVELPDERAHPDYGYACVDEAEDPSPN